MKPGARFLLRLITDIERGETARERLGDTICQFRAGNNIPQKDLAALLDISPQHLSDVEAGKRGLSDVVRLRLSNLLPEML